MILAIDQGTTGHDLPASSTSRRSCVGRAYREFTQHFPQPGWVEHDAAEIWDVTRVGRARGARSPPASPAGALAAVGITNQRETVVAWDERTGAAAAPRDRLAGPPHRGALRRAARAGARGRWCASAPAS